MWAALVVALLQVTVSPVVPESCRAGTLTASADDGPVITREWSEKRALDLQLDRAREWTLQTSAHGCWAERITLRRDDARCEVSIRVWPRRTLAARLVLPRGEGLPASVSARIASPPRGALAETDIACARTEERVQCEVPAMPLDIRFSADGFAPAYFWDVDTADLGEVHLSRGTIVTGRVRATSTVDVELRPSSLAWAPEAQARMRRQRQMAKTNARGFFQFSNVAPGEYTVIATKKDWSPAEYRVHVSPVATEAVVGRELILGELARIEVPMQPPVDVEQRPWTVALSRLTTGNSEPVARSEASLAGEWSHAALEHGVYAVRVLNAGGAVVASEAVRADGGANRVVLSIDQVAVRGTITLGGKPIEAALRFADLHGKRVDLQSDAEGRFTGTLPSQGSWNVDVRRASRVTLRDVDVRRDESGYADLELELPGGRVRGTVVDAEGKPHVANVTLFRDGRREGSVRTEANGEFIFEGVEQGAVELTADARAGQSGMVPHTIRDTEDDSLRIRIAPRNVVRARVVSPDGRAVAGALVVWVSANAVRHDVTGPAGDVTIQLPPDVAAVTIYVSAPGFPLKLARVAPGSGEVAVVHLPAIAGALFIAYDTGRIPYPAFGNGTERVNIGALNGMGMPREGMPLRFVRGGFLLDVEPGSYTVCQALTTRCATREVRAGGRATIDATEWSE